MSRDSHFAGGPSIKKHKYTTNDLIRIYTNNDFTNLHAVLLVQNLIELTFASLAGGSTLITLNPALANVYTD